MVITFAGGNVGSLSLYVPDGGYELKPKHDDLVSERNGYIAPPVRNGIDKSGKCRVIIDDQTAYTESLASIQALRSGVGVGDYTVSLDGVPHSYHALVDVDITGDSCQFAEISWRGTILSVES